VKGALLGTIKKIFSFKIWSVKNNYRSTSRMICFVKKRYRMNAFMKISFIAIYLTTALCADWGHSHVLPGLFDRVGGIFNHNCTTHEVHKSLDPSDFCSICYKLSTSNSFLNTFSNNSLLRIVSPVSILINDNPILSFLFPPLDRAPPQFS
jgi:hypothetical protein